MASQRFNTDPPDLAFSWSRVLVHQHSLPRLHFHATRISAMIPSGSSCPPIPSISSCSFTPTPPLCHHTAEMNFNRNSSFGEGKGRETPIYNSSLPSGLVMAWPQEQGCVRDQSVGTGLPTPPQGRATFT